MPYLLEQIHREDFFNYLEKGKYAEDKAKAAAESPKEFVRFIHQVRDVAYQNMAWYQEQSIDKYRSSLALIQKDLERCSGGCRTHKDVMTRFLAKPPLAQARLLTEASYNIFDKGLPYVKEKRERARDGIFPIYSSEDMRAAEDVAWLHQDAAQHDAAQDRAELPQYTLDDNDLPAPEDYEHSLPVFRA